MKLPYEDEAIAKYTSGEKTTVIKKELNISDSQLYNCLRKNNISLRGGRNTEGRAEKTFKRCPVCKTKANPAKARFCCMCGADIRSSKEICIERLSVALGNVAFLPDGVRDETVEIIREAMNELKK